MDNNSMGVLDMGIPEDNGYVWDNQPMKDCNAVGDGYDVTTGEYTTTENKEGVENND